MQLFRSMEHLPPAIAVGPSGLQAPQNAAGTAQRGKGFELGVGAAVETTKDVSSD